MPLLSFQSSVVYGHVGNSAARFALERMGHEVWALDTVRLAHHPGYGEWRGRITPPDEIATLVEGLAARGALQRCDALLSGYLGDAALGGELLELLARVKAARPDALYACDPVMGDSEKGFYVRPGIPPFFRDHAIPRTDILLPNRFELGWLAGVAVDSVETALAAARALLARGPTLVVVKGLGEEGRIGSLAVAAEGAFLAECPAAPSRAHGAGDCFSALFLGHYLSHREAPAALTHAVSALHAVMTATAAAGADELALIAAQGALLRPKRLFKAVQIG